MEKAVVESQEREGGCLGNGQTGMRKRSGPGLGEAGPRRVKSTAVERSAETGGGLFLPYAQNLTAYLADDICPRCWTEGQSLDDRDEEW